MVNSRFLATIVAAMELRTVYRIAAEDDHKKEYTSAYCWQQYSAHYFEIFSI